MASDRKPGTLQSAAVSPGPKSPVKAHLDGSEGGGAHHRVRVEQARDLLRQSRLDVEEIAELFQPTPAQLA